MAEKKEKEKSARDVLIVSTLGASVVGLPLPETKETSQAPTPLLSR